MKRQQGLTLVELIVASAIGLFVIGGAYSLFGLSARSVQSTGHYNQLQSSASMALRMLHDDLAQAGFFADLTGMDLVVGSNLGALPILTGVDCQGSGTNNQTFPTGVGHFRTLWAYSHQTIPLIDCISALQSGSDVLQLKRLMGPELTAGSEQADRYYFINNLTQGQFYAGGMSTPTLTSGRVWQYQHRIYYVAPNLDGVPSLYRRSLTAVGLMTQVEELVIGVEEIKYLFGVDQDGDSIVDSYLTTAQISDAIWDQLGDNRIVAVRVYLLLRSTDIDHALVDNEDRIFVMPDANKVVVADKHRRRLISTTVMMRNPVLTARKE